MAQNVTVSSLPLKDVIIDLATAFAVPYGESCGEYFLELPPHIGIGEIRAINFDNGLGLILYKCTFNEVMTIQYTVDQVHPVKYLYSRKSPIKHRFATESIEHELPMYKCAIVASEQHNGHVLKFDAEQEIHLISLEIDRERFNKNLKCDILTLTPELKNLFTDVDANRQFYHDGYYSLSFKSLLEEFDEIEPQHLVRKLALESKALKIFVNQISLFEDDLLGGANETLLRSNELYLINEIEKYINVNLDEKLSIPILLKKFSINAKKMQEGFKFLFSKTVNEYIIALRLDRSAYLLKNTELSVSEVAYDVGMANLSYFSKKFKQRFGMSPGSYKNNI